jgi:hypothetical protein
MNRLKNRIWVPVALSALVSGGAAAANLVSNGDFDNIGGVWVNNTGLGSDDLQTSGATNIPGWTNVPGAVNEFWVGASNAYSLSAAPGNGSQYFVDLTGQANSGADCLEGGHREAYGQRKEQRRPTDRMSNAGVRLAAQARSRFTRDD